MEAMTKREKMEGKVAMTLLKEEAMMRPELVARHYLAHAALAQSIMGHVEHIRRFGVKGIGHSTHNEVRAHVHDLLRRITQGHLKDLGIALEWK